jgi:hypothetical protein
VTRVPTGHLGVITLPNNGEAWGPWAGKLISGDEQSGKIWAVGTDGSAQGYLLGINPDDPDDFELVPASNHLYIVLSNGEQSAAFGL